MKKYTKRVICLIACMSVLMGCQKEPNPDKAVDLYEGENVDKIVTKAYNYFNRNVSSAIIEETSESTSENAYNSKTIISFENKNSDEYIVREEETNSYATYTDKDGYYIREDGEDKFKKRISKENHYNTNYYDIKSNSFYDVDADNCYTKGKKEKIVNDDGSIDIVIHADDELYNRKAKEDYDYELSQEHIQEYVSKLEDEYSKFLEKDQMIQSALNELGTGITYIYPGTCYVKIHINEIGFIEEMIRYEEIDTYQNFVNGIDNRSSTTNTIKITNINNNEVKKDDVEKLDDLESEDKFTKNLTPEETDKIVDGDIIEQYPDVQTLINKDLYYLLDENTGEIRLIPLEVGYRSWCGVWDISRGGSKEEIEDQELITMLENLPGFQEALNNNPFDGRIDYYGNGEWGY